LQHEGARVEGFGHEGELEDEEGGEEDGVKPIDPCGADEVEEAADFTR
jgi:hypothetical protein